MKILQPVSTAQTLKVIPRSYPETVDISLRNEDTNETFLLEDLSAVYNGGYLDVESTFGLSVVSGVKCIAANNEHLSSPVGDYFGGTISGLDIEFQISDLTSSSFYFASQRSVTAEDSYIYVRKWLGDAIRLGIKNNLGESQNITSSDAIENIENGTIRIVGSVGFVSFYYNDVLLSTEVVTIDDNISLVSSGVLNFNQSYTSGGEGNGTFNYIKIGIHEWLSSNWTAPTTTNSQGVVTTLHSDVSTSAMIIQTN